MARSKVRPYLSSAMVLLAFDWPEGATKNDFLGFAIKREPGFNRNRSSWLPNRIGFEGPAPRGEDLPTNKNPIQKFMWWDARINENDIGKAFTYTVFPVVGTKDNPLLVKTNSISTDIRIPEKEVNNIGTYFNRAVVSSQAFSKKFKRITKEKLPQALEWLANGLEKVISNFSQDAQSVEGAVYHLSDEVWVIPTFANYDGNISIVLDSNQEDESNDVAKQILGSKATVQLIPRTKSNIMHNKMLVKFRNGNPSSLLTGSANFTTGGLSTQANLLHTFRSPQLAELYLARKRFLQHDPTMPNTAKKGEWSGSINIGSARIRVFFSPEPSKSRSSIDQIIDSIHKSKKSIIFCLYSTTDKPLRDAIFEEADKGKMMFGLVNTINEPKKVADEEDVEVKPRADTVARVEIYHRSRKDKDVYSHSLFPKKSSPKGFWWERSTLPGMGKKFPVYIHHKFIVIDAETRNPIIYTGSANMSNNSLHKNDENILEIRKSHRLAEVYLSEFLRLYEHYRARSIWNQWQEGKRKDYKLMGDSSWAKDYYKVGTPKYKSRINLSAR